MNTSDSRAGASSGAPDDGKPQNFQHLKEDVTQALGGARQQADAQFGEYRDTAADQIEALAQGAKVSSPRSKTRTPWACPIT